MAGLLVNLDVSDLAAAIEFYTTGLGLRLVRRLGPDIAELSGASVPLFLTEQPAGSAPFPGSATPREYGRHWTPIHVDFVVPDLEPALRRAESAGARREGGIREFVWGRYAVLADPFGHGFCILQFEGDGYAGIGSESGAEPCGLARRALLAGQPLTRSDAPARAPSRRASARARAAPRGGSRAPSRTRGR